MIGIKNIPKFQILINGKHKTVALRERKAAEKGWFLVLSECQRALDKLEVEVEKRRCNDYPCPVDCVLLMLQIAP